MKDVWEYVLNISAWNLRFEGMKEYKSKEWKGKQVFIRARGVRRKNDPMVEWALDLEYLSESFVM